MNNQSLQKNFKIFYSTNNKITISKINYMINRFSALTLLIVHLIQSRASCTSYLIYRFSCVSRILTSSLTLSGDIHRNNYMLFFKKDWARIMTSTTNINVLNEFGSTCFPNLCTLIMTIKSRIFWLFCQMKE